MPFQRLTERREGKAFINTEILQREETGFTGEAAERLAAFEDVYEHLLQSQETLSAKLEESSAARERPVPINLRRPWEKSS